MSIILEPIAWLSRYHMHSASEERRSARFKSNMAPVLCDLCDPSRSPATLVLEYLSLIASGDAPRLILLCGREFGNFQEFAENHPEALRVLRRGVAVAGAWVYARSFQRWQCYPWRLAALSDPRSSDEVKREVANEFWDAQPEQLDECFGGRLRAAMVARGLDASSLLEGDLQAMFWMWSHSVVTTVAPIEFHHGRNRRRAPIGTKLKEKRKTQHQKKTTQARALCRELEPLHRQSGQR